jgi:hypothetical protein
MIRGQRPAASEHERMVMSNYRTMRLLTELKDKPLTHEVTAGP